MARGFGSTLGTGSSDKITSGYTTAASSTYSISAWIWVNGLGGANFGGITSSNTGPAIRRRISCCL